jgi:hypothetical protein
VSDQGLDAGAIFNVLASNQVDYLLVGGFAVSAHGYIRATDDVDICHPDPENLQRLAAAIEEDLLDLRRLREAREEDR